MRDSLKSLCESFIQNRDMLNSTFKWESQYIVPVCASELCGKKVVVSQEKLLQCKQIVEKKTGIFSGFRGNVKLPLITKLTQDGYAEYKMDKTLQIYDILKKHFWGSEYLVLIAVILADMIELNEAESYVVRGKRIYDLMKKEHPFLTSGEDSVFAVLMAFSDKSEQELIVDMETCYQLMKREFSEGNSLQSLTHVLSLAQGTPEEKCGRVLTVYQGLKNAGRKYGKYYELAVLGSLSLLSTDTNTIIEDMLSVDSFLAQQKGYGFWGIDQKTRLMHAAMLVSNDYAKKSNTNTAAITGTLAMIAAQQAAMCAVIAATAVNADN